MREIMEMMDENPDTWAHLFPEKEVLKKARTGWKQRGLRMKNTRKATRSLITLKGVYLYERTCYVPKDEETRQRLMAEGNTTFYPMDIKLGVDRLPFKMSPGAMLKCAEVAVSTETFQQAEDMLCGPYNVQAGNATIRAVTNYISRIVWPLNREGQSNELARDPKHGPAILRQNLKNMLLDGRWDVVKESLYAELLK
ncbi:MAG: hypothetical protein IJ083_15450 [Clostridia bacterium]|nr:hypothetical protein [Clostridia bacterium]